MLALSVMEAGRCRWSTASLAKESLGWMGMALVGGLIFCVVSVNTDLSRMVRIQNDRGHTVITSGPGRFVHHPMYFIFMFLWYWVPIGD
jgi:protein-S-isoprenylcysteine O-methyltransferase Ste14